MARQQEGFFAEYDPSDLELQATLTLSQRELLLIRTALGTLMEETSRHDHIYNDIHALVAKLPAAPARRVPAGASASVAPGRAKSR